ncbi:E3 SUMO-protein ligase [Lachnellula willkommii]|uniref:E3 SUMO-protein ligase n=1 Tax=Lachnellula willkommii TaxID=215461 RepID=A0A559M560_9HELO|nr:E3 SUMO-protein ligase [Lachnellula willkommii]
MSSRRHLVSRSRVNNQDSSPAPRGSESARQRDAPARQPVALPPYEPPSFPLTHAAQRDLDNLRTNHDYSKYKKHLGGAIKAITGCATQINDQLTDRKELVRRGEEKRRLAGQGDEDKTEEQNDRESQARFMERKVGDLTAKAEKALRELIDYGDELAMQDAMMTDVSGSIAAVPVVQPRASRHRRARGNGEDDEEENGEEDASQDGDGSPGEDQEVLSAVELLRKAKQDYLAQYSSKTMLERYDVNDFRLFKQVVHDAQHPSDDAPPVPHARTWFPEDNATQGSSSRRRRNNTTDNTSNAGDSDDDIVIQRATTNLRCPFTMGIFVEPFTSNKCKHTFEKEAILNYIETNGTQFATPGQPGRGTKQVKCPTSGCDVMLKPEDFYDDAVIRRKVERAKKREELGDEDDEDDAPRKKRATSINDDSPSPTNGDDHEEDQRQKIARVKRERQKSRGPSVAPARLTELSDDDVEAMDEEE